VAPPENSVTNSRADCALTQQTVGGTKAISPCVKSASAKLFPDLHTMSAPSGEERTLDTSAQVERAGRYSRRFDSGTHAWCGRATVMVLVSSASGPRVSGCIRDPLNFNPYPLSVPTVAERIREVSVTTTEAPCPRRRRLVPARLHALAGATVDQAGSQTNEAAVGCAASVGHRWQQQPAQQNRP
jgi:hypothetical protein